MFEDSWDKPLKRLSGDRKLKFLSERQQWKLSPKEKGIKHGSWAEKEVAIGQEAEMDYQKHCKYISGSNCMKMEV